MSIIKQKKQRVAIFIDTQNLYHSAKSLYGSNVNFKNILEDTLAERELVRVIAYVITTESGEEKNFFEALKKAGIETKSKDLQIFLGGAKKGDWDVGMTVDAIRLASSVDAIIIVSGDGDFIPLVEYLKFSNGCQVEAASFGSSASAGLIEVVDDFFDLSNNPDRYLIRKNKYNKFKRFKSKQFNNNFLENSVNKNNLSIETPEMIAERILAKKKFNNKEKITLKDNKKATEVEITRVKKEDIISPKKNKKIITRVKKEKTTSPVTRITKKNIKKK